MNYSTNAPTGPRTIGAAIAERYDLKTGWVTMHEVTPPNEKRRFDAIAISAFQSHQAQVQGFEIKTARSDWLRELADQTKAGTLMRYCTHYWLVAPAGVAEESELPPGWGLLRATQGDDGGWSLRAVKRPTLNADAAAAWSSAFWRCMLLHLRLHQRTPVTPAEIAAARDYGYKCGHSDGVDQSKNDVERHRESADRLNVIIAAFARGSGIWIGHRAQADDATTWESYGRLMRTSGGLDRQRAAKRLQQAARELEDQAKRLRNEAEDMQPQTEQVAS